MVGNFYLHSLDEAIRDAGVKHLRYMDDLWVFTDRFSEARRTQDLIERFLYPLGLTLSGEKSKVMRRSTALAEAETADAIIERHRRVFREDALARLAMASYLDEDVDLDPDEIDVAAVLDLYGEILTELREDRYPPQFRSTLREVYRELAAARRPEALADVPELLHRFPDLTGDGSSYAAHVASTDRAAAIRVFLKILTDGRFHREQELVQICRWALYLPRDERLASAFGELALSNPHRLVRARALLAWGALSAPEDFATADAFWRSTHRPWRAYPFVAIQDKEPGGRDDRYRRWSGAGRLLDRLRASIQVQRFSWKKV